jgi:hypothetical protein
MLIGQLDVFLGNELPRDLLGPVLGSLRSPSSPKPTGSSAIVAS